MPIYKRCSRCGARIPTGSICRCNSIRHKEYDRFSRDAKSKAFYNSKEWREAQRFVLETDGGIDVYAYMTTGQIIAADTVHHIIPLRDDWSKRIEISNLISLSGATHGRIEKAYHTDKSRMIRELKEMVETYRRMEREGGI